MLVAGNVPVSYKRKIICHFLTILFVDIAYEVFVFLEPHARPLTKELSLILQARMKVSHPRHPCYGK